MAQTLHRVLPGTTGTTGKLTRGSLPRPRLDFANATSSLSGSMSFPPPPGGPIPPKSYDAAVRFLINHATLGFTVPDYMEALTMGYEDWLEWQLDYLAVDDTAVDDALASYPTLTMSNAELYGNYTDDPATVVYELLEALNIRAIYSRRQLYERMVEFWSDHLNINQLDDFALWFKTTDDRKVVRKHALGYFPDMLKQSPRSAAMLWYLDNYNSIAGATQENYGRELLELHTVGVNGPYTEDDVKNVARCFTGWTFGGVFTNHPFGKFVYLDQYHDKGAKTVLGQNIPAGGDISDGEFVLDMLAMHPATAEYISTKMARWLLSYDPPQDLIDRLVTIYLSTGGHIPPMVREILSLQTVGSIPRNELRKHKRPFHLVTAIMRAGQVSSSNLLQLSAEMQSMEMVPYWFPTPDGYPDTIDKWGKALLPRWDFASRLFAGQVPGNEPDHAVLKALMATAPPGSSDAEAINWVLTGGDVHPDYVQGVQAFMDGQSGLPKIVRGEAFALTSSSPSFQYY